MRIGVIHFENDYTGCNAKVMREVWYDVLELMYEVYGES